MTGQGPERSVRRPFTPTATQRAAMGRVLARRMGGHLADANASGWLTHVDAMLAAIEEPVETEPTPIRTITLDAAQQRRVEAARASIEVAEQVMAANQRQRNPLPETAAWSLLADAKALLGLIEETR